MRLGRIAAVVGLGVSAACNVPTDFPIIEQEWIVPLASTTISLSQLLPNGVSISGSSFAVDVGAFAATRTLGQVCSACVNGTTSLPAFDFTFTSTPQNLPAGLFEGQLTSGTISLQVQNGFSFDPTSNGGTVTISVIEASGRVLGTTTFVGSALPAGQTTTRAITVSGGSIGTRFGSQISSRTTIDSKAVGTAVTMNTSSQLTVTATPQNLLMSSAGVSLAGKAFNIDPQDLDVAEIDTDVIDHLQSGAIILDVTNPFGAMTATIRINYPGGSLVKNVSLSNDYNPTVTLSYTDAELKRFLGQPSVMLTGNGTMNPAGGLFGVTPTAVVTLKAKLAAKIRLGE